ncbi:thioredoxin [Candidatus Fokinia crypta]|uniref:Thioredoxin n=1 Tax=Candidatus Fokinia crypta TaxID=1920990 RepID=A0ABZ0UQB9_9RICK|nr:thioredoxin [Candidatus Fokinia cryptica]WPX98082.1 Thioredoxin [Candidatus Fokinia cryptica]
MFGSVVEVTDKNFNTLVVEVSGYVLVDFWAPWCGPCKALTPILESFAKSYEGRVKVCKMNVDENTEVVASVGVRGIPMLILYKDGKQIASQVGAATLEQLDVWVKSYIQ